MEPRLGVLATISIIIALAATGPQIDRVTSGAAFNDSIEYTIIPYNKAKWVFDDDAKRNPSTLTEQEIQNIEPLLKQAVDSHNPRMQAWFDSLSKEHRDLKLEHFIIVLNRYVRQFVPVINEKGEKEVFVNCVCRPSAYRKDWKYGVISPRDGGNCYFHVIINLTKGTWYHMSVNGDV